jgi:hypothetical protein
MTIKSTLNILSFVYVFLFMFTLPSNVSSVALFFCIFISTFLWFLFHYQSEKNNKLSVSTGILLVCVVSFVNLNAYSLFDQTRSISHSSSSASSGEQSKKGSYSSCTSTCGSNRDICEAQGTSYEICKGGEGYCLTDCCVMYQSSDEYAAAMCR